MRRGRCQGRKDPRQLRRLLGGVGRRRGEALAERAGVGARGGRCRWDLGRAAGPGRGPGCRFDGASERWEAVQTADATARGIGAQIASAALKRTGGSWSGLQLRTARVPAG